MNGKTCPKCKLEKSANDFHKSGSRKDKLRAYCKKCEYEHSKSPEGKGNWLRRYWPGTTAKEAFAKYNELFTYQEGCCAICCKHQSELKHALAVDHNHTTGHVRGLLCVNCNTILGKLDDDVRLIINCIDYLTNRNER